VSVLVAVSTRDEHFSSNNSRNKGALQDESSGLSPKK
jgi:hypothetical protein